jgi:hypothetical protein
MRELRKVSVGNTDNQTINIGKETELRCFLCTHKATICKMVWDGTGTKILVSFVTSRDTLYESEYTNPSVTLTDTSNGQTAQSKESQFSHETGLMKRYSALANEEVQVWVHFDPLPLHMKNASFRFSTVLVTNISW